MKWFSASAFLLCISAFTAVFPLPASAADLTFKPVRDDKLAAEFAPVIINNEKWGPVVGLKYRAAVDSEGNTWLAFHVVWNYERNDSPGFGAWLSRKIYTGGPYFQKSIFGPGDIEVILLKLSKDKKELWLQYETADNYDPKNFTVTHKTLTMDKDIPRPLSFKVISWNHLFIPADSAVGPDGHTRVKTAPEYFTKTEWDYFRMFKEKESFFSKSRAHASWERISAE